MEQIRNPLQLLPGGYISVYDVQYGAGWSQLDGPAAAEMFLPPACRQPA